MRKTRAILVSLLLALFASSTLTSCDAIDALLDPTGEQEFAENTGVLRLDGVRERWTEAEILAGEADEQLDHIVGDVSITGDTWDDNPTDGVINFHDYWVDGCISVQQSNVRIFNVLVRSNHPCGGGYQGNAGQAAIISNGYAPDPRTNPATTNLFVYDTEINGLNTNFDLAGIGQANWIGVNLNIHGVVKGARMDINAGLYHSYVHDLHFSNRPEDHGEGIFWGGGEGPLVIENNWIQANASTGAIAFLNDWDGANAKVNHNYIDGNGGVGFRGGAYQHKVQPTRGAFFHHVEFTNNVIKNNVSPNDVEAWCDTCAGNVWTNNVDENGVPYAEPTPAP